MSRFFDMESPLFRGLSRLADIMILNVVFLICCVPVVTIGASLTAMSYVALKMKDEEEGYIIRSFFRSFKLNFKQATLIWLLMLFLGVFIGLDFVIIGSMEGTAAALMKVLVGMGAMIWLMIFVYVFPLQARFYNSIKATMQNAIILAVANFPKTFCMMAVIVGAVLLTLWNGYTLWYGLLVWSLGGFAFIAWINSHFLYGIFKKLMPQEEGEIDANEGELSSESKKIL